jgi:predicted nucleotidyltransferase
MQVEAVIVDRIVEWAKSVPLISRVWLYGSRVRGNARSDSDLDVGVELCAEADEFSWFDNGAIWKAQLAKVARNCPKVHLELIEVGVSTVWPAIEDHGVLVYEQTRE